MPAFYANWFPDNRLFCCIVLIPHFNWKRRFLICNRVFSVRVWETFCKLIDLFNLISLIIWLKELELFEVTSLFVVCSKFLATSCLFLALHVHPELPIHRYRRIFHWAPLLLCSSNSLALQLPESQSCLWIPLF